MLKQLKQQKVFCTIAAAWGRFRTKHPGLAEFLVFFLISNGITVLQMALMPLFKLVFNLTPLVEVNFQVGQLGQNFDGSEYYMFNYAAGPLTAGGGGGLAYFLAVQVTLAIAQVINFFGQRNVTFKSTGNVWKAAGWYLVAYIAITLAAAALQGLYKAPVYNLFIGMAGGTGETLADLVTMLITCAISFWVYYPILKIIFRKKGKPKREI